MADVGVTVRRGAPGETDADTRVVGLFEGEPLEEPELQALVDSGEAKPALKKVALAHVGSKRVIVAGLGKRDEFDSDKARIAASSAAARASEIGTRSLSWAAPSAEVAGGLVEGTLLKLYKFDRFKSKKDDDADSGGVESLEISSVDADLAEPVNRARVGAEATNRARDLQNLPSNVATPEFLAERAREVAGAHDTLEFDSFGRDGIRGMGMGALTAVAQGTYAEPQLIVLRYTGPGARGPHLSLVGKAVTFDTGGSSMKPGDIVSAMNGKTIEINNTDAEGRLILADALCYAVDQGAERIVDIATLTGAIVVALGSTYAGLFANDDDWYGQVEAAGNATGELGWRMPLHPEYFELTKGQYADLTNASEVRKAPSSYAAEFLRQFVDDKPWVHMDIAGTAWNTALPYVGSGASGFGTRTFIELASKLA
jgi:leucyl aminopeptidase